MNLTLVAVVAVALFFDFTNGFHDTANAIATTVSTRAVPPTIAVIGAAILNFFGAFLSLKVAATVAKGIVNPKAITLHIVLAGLVGAIIWNLITWRFGMPTSSSHALIGGMAGSAVAAAGWHVINWHGLEHKVALPALAAPFIGLIGAGLLMLSLLQFTKRYKPEAVDRVFKRLQVVSGGFVAFTHGTNDAQKTMGIIALALIASHPDKAFHVPLWVIVSSATAMGLGTYLGGWRIINTLGTKITHLKPAQGFAAETATAATLFVAAKAGFPVSTTHTVSGSILGAGAVTRPSIVNWKVVLNILAAWVFTIPCAAAVGAVSEALLRASSTSVVLIIAILFASTIFFTRNWGRESLTQLRSRFSFLRHRRA